jgi:hypothetical protein
MRSRIHSIAGRTVYSLYNAEVGSTSSATNSCDGRCNLISNRTPVLSAITRQTMNAMASAADGRPQPSTDSASRGRSRATVRDVDFSRELRSDVLAGDITLSVRLWKRPRVKRGGRYAVGFGEIEVDAIELVPFAAITREDVRRAGETDRETLRQRAAHAGPIDEDTLVYRIEFHAVTLRD